MRPLHLRDVLQVNPDPRPRGGPAAHGVDEHVRRLQQGPAIGVPGLPWVVLASALVPLALSAGLSGALVGGSVAAFLAPPFTGLDTLPSLGVVLLSLGVLLEDILVVIVAVLVALSGVVLEIVLGSAAVGGIKSLF